MSVNIKAAMVSHLYNTLPIQRLVGDRIYQDIAPESADYPYITVQHLGAIPGRHLTATSGYTEALLQINAWGAARPSVDDVTDAIRETLDHLTATTLGIAPNEATIALITLNRDPDEWIPPRAGESDGIYGGRQTATIFHDESVPTFA